MPLYRADSRNCTSRKGCCMCAGRGRVFARASHYLLLLEGFTAIHQELGIGSGSFWMAVKSSKRSWYWSAADQLLDALQGALAPAAG